MWHMKDNFEKFIQTHRSEFDNESPGEDIWKNIEKTIPAKKTSNQFSFGIIARWTAAAAIVFAAITTLYFLNARKNNPEENTASELSTEKNIFINMKDLGGITSEQAAELNRIFSIISASRQELKNVASDRPELYEQFMNDLAVLESSYNSLHSQALQSPNRDIIIKAMMQNLQLQSELIYRQLKISKEYKQQKNIQNEKAI